MRIATSIKLIVLGAVLVAAGLGVHHVRRVISSEHLRRQLSERLDRTFEGDFHFEDPRIDRWGRLTVNNLRLTPPGEEQPVLACQRVNVSFDAAELLYGRMVPREVEVLEPTVHLTHRPETDDWNVTDLLAQREEEPGERPEEEKKPEARVLRDGVHIREATLVVRHPKLLGDPEAREISGLQVDLERANGAWRMRADLLRGPLAGLAVTGWYSAGDSSRAEITMSSPAMPVNRQVLDYVPRGGRVWRDFRPEGQAGVRGEFQLAEDGELRYAVHIDLRKMSTLTRYFPIRAEQATGTVVVSNRGLAVQGVNAVIPSGQFARDGGPAQVRISGDQAWKGGDLLYEVRAEDMPFDRNVVEGIPKVGTELWQRLQPSGRADLKLVIRRSPEQEKVRFRATTDLRATSIHPEELPAPLQRVAGTVVVDGRSVRLRGLEGVLPQNDANGTKEARFSARGVVDLRQEKSNLKVTVENLWTDEQLVKSLPGQGEQIWKTLQPEVTVDLRAHLRDKPDTPLAVENVWLDIHGGSGEAEVWPVPLHHLNGTVQVRDQQVTIERIGALINVREGWRDDPPNESPVNVRGWMDLEKDRGSLHLQGTELVLTGRLLKALPEIGPKVWEEAHPQGIASVSGQILYDAAAESPFRCFLDVHLQDVSIEPRLIPVPVDALSGNVLVMDTQAFTNDFAGITCSGRFEGNAIVNYSPLEQYPSYAATMHFRKLDLNELVGYFGKDQPNARGKISGSVDLGGIYGQEKSFSARGHVSLTEGQLLRVPLFGRLLNVLRLSVPSGRVADQRGEAVFSHSNGVTKIEEFEIVGAGLNISGYGTIGPDKKLDLTLVAIGAPEDSGGIPIISAVADWLLKGIEQQLIRVDVSGTLDNPKYTPRMLSKITWPLRSLRSVLFSPLLGKPAETAE
ncbi:MAG: AsmA-like C-terminal region-containing protein [Planctomycetota bacterium]